MGAGYQEVLDRLEKELQSQEIMPDPTSVSGLDCSTYGLNLAISWPLPAEFKEGYESLIAELGAVEDCVYLYPYKKTHITLVTQTP